MIIETINNKIEFASRRVDEISELIDNNLIGAESKYRQQLVQEFFFHSIGAIDYLAQFIKQEFELEIPEHKVRVEKVVAELNKKSVNKKLTDKFKVLYVKVGKDEKFPDNPYSDYGLLYHLYNYRHITTHRKPNPFNFILSRDKPYFLLYPNLEDTQRSKQPIDTDLKEMLRIVDERCQKIFKLIKGS